MEKLAKQRLILLRHAKSDWNTSGPDIERPLNARGRRDIQRIGGWLASADLGNVLIVHSPATRARDTAEVVHGALAGSRIEEDDDLYLASRDELLAVAQKHAASCVILVAHNPGLEDLVRWLDPQVESTVQATKIFPTAAVYGFEMAAGINNESLNEGDEETRLAQVRFLFHQRPKRLAPAS